MDINESTPHRWSLPALVVVVGLGIATFGTTPAPVAAQEESDDQASPDSIEAFIDAAYQGLLGRAPDSSGREYWRSEIEQGVSPRRVLVALGDSLEHRRHLLTGTYDTFLRRDPDAGGLQWWTERLGRTRSVTSLRADILASSEYRSVQGDGTDAGFVDAVYRDVLGRSPDATGRAYWTDRLAAGVSHRRVAHSILVSSEAFRFTDLPVTSVDPRPGSTAWDLEIEADLDAALFTDASTIDVSVDGRRLDGTVEVDGGTIAFSPDARPAWVPFDSTAEVVVTVFGYDGQILDRMDYAFTYHSPTAVSSFTTPLVPGQSRNTNIQRAAELINGDVIAPGATYSLNEAIGERTSARGFVENGFIDGEGETVSTVGGGVSQVSTTVMNAAWEAGLDVSFRPHTIYFPRYPMCREATIVWGQLDMVTVNNSPYEIIVATSASESEVTVTFYSAPWASVDSWIGEPFDVGGVGGPFTVECGRTISYPDGTSDEERYTWSYNEGYPG
ncbi:MAG: VanW family protein [Acidimicrobiales bacterium]